MDFSKLYDKIGKKLFVPSVENGKFINVFHLGALHYCLTKSPIEKVGDGIERVDINWGNEVSRWKWATQLDFDYYAAHGLKMIQ